MSKYLRWSSLSILCLPMLLIPTGCGDSSKKEALVIPPSMQANNDAINQISEARSKGLESNPPDYDQLIAAGKMAEEKLAEIDTKNPQNAIFLAATFYEQACGYARKGDTEAAVAALERSLGLGFKDLSQIEKNPDLEALRASPQYEKVTAKLAEAEKARIDSEVDKAMVASPFPFDFELANLDGAKVKLADLRGKVTIVDVWGTWCPPCRMEIPHFVELQKELGSEGLQVIGINYEQVPEAEMTGVIKDFAKEYGIAYPLVLGDDATRNQIPGFQGYPTTLFLDGDGVVRAMTVGYHSKENLEGIVRRILAKS